MDLDLIERLMRLLETSSVNELELTENGTRIRLSKSAVPVAQTAGPSPREPAADAALPSVQAGSREHVIVAGLSGTFYRAPMPGEAPFISIGDPVEDGRKLGIIEAMKMMNPVEADCDGRVTAIHLEDGAPVTSGMAVFTIEKTA